MYVVGHRDFVLLLFPNPFARARNARAPSFVARRCTPGKLAVPRRDDAAAATLAEAG